MTKFPRLTSDSSFPNVGSVDVFKYDNDYDYGRFDCVQMHLQLCTVPWDMGEAHIGNRTISGIGNVVYFGTPDERDAWFAAIPDDECYRFDTKFKELHRESMIDVEVPFDMCARHNYLVVEYEMAASEEYPLKFQGSDGVRKWFWFVREVEFLANNTTRLHLMPDAFQTWIYDVNVSGMVLERGHAPMFALTADEFLADPIGTNDYLLTEDVNFGTASIVPHADALVLNSGNMYACIATRGNPLGTWGTKADNNWKVPAATHYQNGGVPSVYVFAMKAADLNTFLLNITRDVPQFKQTVEGVFFASADLLDFGDTFTFADTTCYKVFSSRKTVEFVDLNKKMFDYDPRYAEIAKLYTSPYAHIELTDENGNVNIVKIEDTTGKLDVSLMLSLAYPYVSIDAHLLGVGSKSNSTVVYRNMKGHEFDFGGMWYETLRSWNVPTFAVVLDPAKENDYATHFDRAQRKVDYDASYDNATASASTAKSNADASADIAADNAATLASATIANGAASAGAITANAALTAACNDAVTARSNQSANDQLLWAQTFNSGMATFDNIILDMNCNATIAANEQQAAVTAIGASITGAVGAISSAASGDVGGALSSSVSAIVGAGTTIANTAIAANLSQTQAGYQKNANTSHATAANTKSGEDVRIQTEAATDIKDANNLMIDGIASNNADVTSGNASRSGNAEISAADAARNVQKQNNLRDYNTATANAGRTKSAAQSGVTNSVNQAALRNPSMFGNFANGDGATTKPQALFANIVTQSRSAIKSAGDEMLRYGYMFDQQWEFDGDWNVGKFFTYWKLKDFWVSGLNVPDMYMDYLRFFLLGGVTVWRKPEYIGNVTIYDNGKEV